MARARMLKPDFFKDEDLADVSFAARILFAGLWTLADREGRLEDRPRRIKVEVFPYDKVDVDALLNELSRGGFILRYRSSNRVNGCLTDNSAAYISIPTFIKHQRPHPKEPESEIPPPSILINVPCNAVEKHGEPCKETAKPSESIPSIPSESVTVTGRDGVSLTDAVLEVYAAYPRKVAKAEALVAIRKALEQLGRRNGTNAHQWLLERVRLFAKSPSGNRGTFTPHPATWMNAGRYDDDPAEWNKTGDDNPKPRHTPESVLNANAKIRAAQDIPTDIAAKLIAEQRAPRVMPQPPPPKTTAAISNLGDLLPEVPK